MAYALLDTGLNGYNAAPRGILVGFPARKAFNPPLVCQFDSAIAHRGEKLLQRSETQVGIGFLLLANRGVRHARVVVAGEKDSVIR